MDMSGLNTVKRNGDVVSVAPTFGNTAANACSITNATVSIAFPLGDGSRGPDIVVATNVTLSKGQTKTFPSRKHTVAFDSGVFRGFVWITIHGVWHAADPEPDPMDIGAMGRPLVISRPHTTLQVTPVPSGGPPFTIAYTYTVENDSASDPAGEVSNPTPDVSGPTLKNDRCSPVDYVSGDTVPESPATLTHGETWTFTCTRSFPLGSLVNIATFTGFSSRDGRAWPKRTVRTAYCGRLPATKVGTNRANTITGTPGQDVIIGRGGNDTIKGLGGDDIVCGGGGADVIRGGDGSDTLRGEDGDDRLIGGPGTDTLLGGPGHDFTQQ
jgi:hypothetical protein